MTKKNGVGKLWSLDEVKKFCGRQDGTLINGKVGECLIEWKISIVVPESDKCRREPTSRAAAVGVNNSLT